MSRSLMKEAGQSYVFSWGWFLGGMVVLTLLCLSAYGMRTLNMFSMAQQIVDISEGLEKEGDLRGAIDVLASFLESHPNNPGVWKRQCDLWNNLYQSQRMTSRDMLTKAIERHKRAIPFLKDDSIKEVRERILEMELEVAKSDPSGLAWAGTLLNAREIRQLWNNHPLATKVLAMGAYRRFIMTEQRPANEDLPLDKLLQTAWELNRGDIDLAIDYAAFLRGVKPDWQLVISQGLLTKDATMRNAEADEVIDTMVSENPNDATAYLTRYDYQRSHNQLDFSKSEMAPDLVKALEFAPNAPRALKYAGLQMFIRSQTIRAQGKIQEADESREKARDYFVRVTQVNPNDPEGYLLLGKWYMASNQPKEALKTWETGRRNVDRFSPDIVSEVAYTSIEQKLFDQAKNAIADLEQFRVTVGPKLRGADNARLGRTCGLLRGKLYLAQRDDALAQQAEANRKIEDAQARNVAVDPNLRKLAEDSSVAAERLRGLAYREISSQLNGLDEMLFDLSGGTVLSRLEGDGFISLGRLDAEFQMWDNAAKWYEKARVFPAVAPLATIQAANAYERANRFDTALATLQSGAKRYPENPALRFFYLNALFAQELAKPEPVGRNYTLMENELNEVALLQDRLTQPWKLDTMRVRLQYVRGGGTRQVQQECLSRLRELESNVKYAEDPQFYAEIASQYSSMGAFEDFNRAINRVRELPKGETPYYVLRIEDARRRGDMTSALSFADEALALVPEAEKSRFTRVREILENPGSAAYLDPDEEYGRLKDLYEGKKIHDPQTFFELANLAFSRGEVEIAKNIEDRLKQIEGETGTLWRYLAVRRLIKQAGGDPGSELLNNARAIQRDIAGTRPNWDMTYVLKAEIEKESGNTLEAIVAYEAAVDRGCRQPTVYRDLITLLYQSGRANDAEKIRKIAGGIFGAAFFGTENVFPPPYQGYYEQIFKALQEGNVGSADNLANACIKRAVENRESTDLILDLNTRIGKLFMDSSNEASAERFLATLAEKGGKFVFPLAVCYVKMEKTDEAFELLVRELEKPTVDPSILVSLLILSTQAKPSEAVFQKIDLQLERLEPLFTDKMETLIQLADYWINRDRLDQAIPIYRKGLELEPGSLLVLNNLAMLLAENARKGKISTIARGEFRADEVKRIPLAIPQPRKTYIFRFPGQTVPNPEDFRFLATP
ncbi:MAG: hypothetical protein FWC43_01095 [Planctomycetaceae bacterium]|nr:hypothetical protein [Planctomycetaceae bacterium]